MISNRNGAKYREYRSASVVVHRGTGKEKLVDQRRTRWRVDGCRKRERERKERDQPEGKKRKEEERDGCPASRRPRRHKRIRATCRRFALFYRSASGYSPHVVLGQEVRLRSSGATRWSSPSFHRWLRGMDGKGFHRRRGKRVRFCSVYSGRDGGGSSSGGGGGGKGGGNGGWGDDGRK